MTVVTVSTKNVLTIVFAYFYMQISSEEERSLRSTINKRRYMMLAITFAMITSLLDGNKRTEVTSECKQKQKYNFPPYVE